MTDLIELGRKLLKNKHYAVVRVKANKKAEKIFNNLQNLVLSMNYEAQYETLLETNYIKIDRLTYNDSSVFYLILFSTRKEDVMILIHDNERKFELFLLHEKLKQLKEDQLLNAILNHLKMNYKKQFDYAF